MTMSNSELFHLASASWLGVQLDSGRQEIITPKKALAYECLPNKGDELGESLKLSLVQESMVIEGLPDNGFALRADKVEARRARECGESTSPSVDLCIRAGEDLMLVECKYKAMPETSIVKTIEAFNFSVTRKFEASRCFYRHEGAVSFIDDCIVLFNGDSKDKVISMFRRLQLEPGGVLLRQYKIMDTTDFWNQYESVVVPRT